VTQQALTFATAFLTLREYLDEHHGAGAFHRVRDGLAARGLQLDPVIVPHRWYPTATLCTALDLARERYGPDDFYERYGRAAAERQVHLAFRFLLRFTTPAWLWQRGAGMWRRAHTTGVWNIESRGRWVRGTLSDFGVVHVGYCRMLVGWLTRACEMTGARPGVVNHSACRALGAAACVFEGEW